ncbi:MAG: DUF4386 family protein, partial [Clostridia bacterium]|nr:DUF4386 family protein [Clostridia bacterium]
MRKAISVTVICGGIAVLAVALVTLAGSRLALSHQTGDTQSLWLFYSLHRWAFLLGEVPLGANMCLAGYLLSPSRWTKQPWNRPAVLPGQRLLGPR